MLLILKIELKFIKRWNLLITHLPNDLANQDRNVKTRINTLYINIVFAIFTGYLCLMRESLFYTSLLLTSYHLEKDFEILDFQNYQTRFHCNDRITCVHNCGFTSNMLASGSQSEIHPKIRQQIENDNKGHVPQNLKNLYDKSMYFE